MFFGEKPVKEIPVGAILAHSTMLNGKRLSKGHRLSEDDISALCGTKNPDRITVAILGPEDVHEDDAADRLSQAVHSQGVTASKAFTGRSNLIADADGLLRLDHDVLDRINHVDEAVTIATLANHERVAQKQMVATIKIIPFAVSEAKLSRCEELSSKDAIRVYPFQPLRCALVQTKLANTKPSVLEKTKSVLQQRVDSLGGSIDAEIHCDHDADSVKKAIIAASKDNPDLILITGASAVTDRRDVLPAGLKEAGGEIIHFGMPVDPGNLLLLGCLDNVPVIGMPGCARSPKLNGFDWVLQRIFAGLIPTSDEIMNMGVGGLLKEIQSRPQPRNETKKTDLPHLPSVAGLVLAAGRSTRMGPDNKLLAEVGDKPMIAHILSALGNARVSTIHVVTGHQHKLIEKAVGDFQVSFVHNPDYQEGLSTSLKRGVAAIPRDSDAVLVCLGDMPFVSAELLDQLVAAYNPAEGRSIIIPTVQGKRGNPVLIGKRYFPEIHEITGDKGAKDLIRHYPDEVCDVPVDEQAVLIDIDTPEALADYRKS